MRKIKRPQVSQDNVLSKFKTLTHHNIIVNESNSYHLQYLNPEGLYEREKARINNNIEYEKHQKKLYTQFFSNKNKCELYQIYTQIKGNTNFCPFCNFPTRKCKQLDHFLPKSIFPSLSITIDNLVPICKECNSVEVKGNYYGTIASEVLLHPYFDDFVNLRREYIGCELIQKDKIGFVFYIKESKVLSSIQISRIKFHFVKMKIDELYNSDFEADFDSFVYELRELKEEYGILHVKKALERKIRGLAKSDLYPWRYIGYKVLYESDWFFDEYL